MQHVAARYDGDYDTTESIYKFYNKPLQLAYNVTILYTAGTQSSEPVPKTQGVRRAEVPCDRESRHRSKAVQETQATVLYTKTSN
jgi:hypothetical protein